jgi:hypothetical protein
VEVSPKPEPYHRLGCDHVQNELGSAFTRNPAVEKEIKLGASPLSRVQPQEKGFGTAGGNLVKKRVIYSILFGIPGLLISAYITFVVAGITAGALWLFVFGDNPWPAAVDTLFPFSLILVFLTGWFAWIALGFGIGKHLEPNPVLNRKHILVSLAVTLIPILLLVYYQWSVGNIGPKSEGERCSAYCSLKGYSASSLPPQNAGERTCSCLDPFGVEKIKIPLKSMDIAK